MNGAPGQLVARAPAHPPHHRRRLTLLLLAALFCAP